MLTNDERKQMQNFQEALGELVDQYLKEGMVVARMRQIMQDEAGSSLDAQAQELDKGRQAMTDAEIAAQLRRLLAAYPLGTMDWPLDVMANAAAALERRTAKFPRLAIESLRNLNRQMDPDGVMVGVSREALHEVLVWVAAYEKEQS